MQKDEKNLKKIGGTGRRFTLYGMALAASRILECGPHKWARELPLLLL